MKHIKTADSVVERHLTIWKKVVGIWSSNEHVGVYGIKGDSGHGLGDLQQVFKIQKKIIYSTRDSYQIKSYLVL